MAGCRCYKAIAGGLDIPDLLGSKSTFRTFGYGGFQGRSLQPGGMIPLLNCKTNLEDQLALPEGLVPK